MLPQDVPFWHWLPALLGGVAMLPAAWFAWRSPSEGGRRAAAFFLAASVWCLAAAAENLGGDVAAHLRWARFGMLGVAFAAPAWALFALRFAGVRLNAWLEGAMLLPAAVTVLLAWSEAGVAWIWSEIRLAEGVPYADAVFVPGPWLGRAFLPYAAVMVAAGVSVLAWRWIRGDEAQTWRYPALMAASAVPVVTAMVHFRAGGGPAAFDATPVAVAAAGVAMAWLVLDRRRFDTLPLAHRLVFDSRPDADLVLDRTGRILDLNPAAERLLGVTLRRVRGRPLARVASYLAAAVPSGAQGEVRDPRTGRRLQVETRRLRRGGAELWTVQDVTERVREREALQRRGLLLEAVDALVAHDAPAPDAATSEPSTPQEGAEGGDALTRTMARIGRALDLDAVRLIVDEGGGEAFTLRAAWQRHGAAPAGRQAYEDAGLIPVRDAIRRGKTTMILPAPSDAHRRAVTLRLGGEAWGALILDGGDPERLDDLRDALDNTARSLAGWLQHERAQRERRRSDRFRAGLLELTRTLLLGRVGEDGYRLAVRHAARAIPGAEAGALFVRRHGHDRFECVASLGRPLGNEARAAQSWSDLGAEVGAGVRTLSGADASDVGPGVRAALLAPVMLDGRAEALLRLESLSRADAFGAREVAMVEAFAAQVGAVLRRLEQQAESERAAAAQRLLADVERLLLTSDDLGVFVPVLARRVLGAKLWPLERLAVLAVRPDGTVDPRVHGPEGRDLALEAEARTAPVRVEALAEVLGTDGPSVARGRGVGPPGLARVPWARAAATFPLRLAGEPWGALTWLSSRADAFGEPTLAWLGQVTSALEMALLRQRDRRRTERQLARLRALVDTGEALRTCTRRADVVKRVLATLREVTGADHCALTLADEAHGGLHVAGEMHRDERSARATGEDGANTRRVRRVLSEDDTVTWAGSDADAGAWMGTPLRNADGNPVGVLHASRGAPGGPFEPDEVGLLEALAQAAAATLVRLALLERSRQQTVQYRALWDEARRSEERFRLLAEHMTDTVCLHDRRGRFLYVSPSVEGLLGYPPGALQGRYPLAMVHDEDVQALRDGLVRPLAQGRAARSVTFRARHNDGHYVWLETGAQPIRDDEERITRHVSTSRDVTERKRIEARLVHGALYDALTGLPNRALLMDRLQHAQDRAHRQGGRFAVMFLDLDRFKHVNDSLGHGVGDEMLASVATRLSSCVRTSDTVARLGGDEFCVLLEEVDDEDTVLRTAERIQASVSRPFDLADTQLFTSASIGIAFSHPDYADPDELLRDADTAMYRAKAEGKARHAVFDAGMHEQAKHRLALDTSLHHAIENDALSLAFQPILRLSDATVIGVEALVRWTDPERGEIPPDEFVKAAEESGAILELDRWVLDRACRQMRTWQETFPRARDWSISVNLSPRHFTVAEPAKRILERVRATGLDPAHLRIELTERALLNGGQAVMEALAELRAHGVTIGIDDFGTGYSSLAHLQRLPLDALKVDGSFVQGLRGPPQQRQMVSTIVALAQGLGIETVAEGVEEQLQWDALRGLGCTYGQGHLWSRAMPAGAFAGRYLSTPADVPPDVRN
ncbi:MAG: EAL domain-containing protein [Trueperaceae bacterium]|nr:EAL domain-containing protein [Trueperaceae bacterium]